MRVGKRTLDCKAAPPARRCRRVVHKRVHPLVAAFHRLYLVRALVVLALGRVNGPVRGERQVSGERPVCSLVVRMDHHAVLRPVAGLVLRLSRRLPSLGVDDGVVPFVVVVDVQRKRCGCVEWSAVLVGLAEVVVVLCHGRLNLSLSIAQFAAISEAVRARE